MYFYLQVLLSGQMHKSSIFFLYLPNLEDGTVVDDRLDPGLVVHVCDALLT
jgi:hypothetical protein